MINAIRKMRFFPLYKLGIVWSMKLTWYDHIEQKCKNLGNIFLVLQVSRLVVEVTTSLPLHPPTTSASSEMLSVFFSIRPWFFGPVAPILKTGARCAPLKSMDFHRRFAQENVPRATTGLSSTFSFKKPKTQGHEGAKTRGGKAAGIQDTTATAMGARGGVKSCRTRFAIGM